MAILEVGSATFLHSSPLRRLGSQAMWHAAS